MKFLVRTEIHVELGISYFAEEIITYSEYFISCHHKAPSTYRIQIFDSVIVKNIVMSEPSKKRVRLPCFKLELQGDSDRKTVFQNKFQKAKLVLQNVSESYVDNYDVLDKALDILIKNCNGRDSTSFPHSFVLLDKAKIENEDVFMTCTSSIEKCLETGKHHERFCEKSLKIEKPVKHGHVLACNLTCTDNHTYRWSSSPYVNGIGASTYYVNQRAYFGYISSGMLACHYERFCDGAKMGRKKEKNSQMDIEML